MNTKPLIRTDTLVWLMLVGLTLVTFSVGQEHLSGLSVSLSLLGVAVLKGHLVGDWFMGLRRVRGPWRWAVAVWLLIPGGLITLAFVLAAGG